jgi:hypothetical protein
MPVRRDPRTGRCYFRVTVKTPDGKKLRLFGTPGVPGPYHELSPNEAGGAVGAKELPGAGGVERALAEQGGEAVHAGPLVNAFDQLPDPGLPL